MELIDVGEKERFLKKVVGVSIVSKRVANGKCEDQAVEGALAAMLDGKPTMNRK